MNKTANLLELILKIGGIMTLLLIIISFIDIKMFYSKFNINIEEYISTSDIIFVAIDKLVLLIIVLLIQLVIWFLWLDKIVEQHSELKENNDQPTLFEHDFIIWKFMRRGWAAYWIILLGGLTTSTLCMRRFPESHFWVTSKDFFYFSFLSSAWLVMSIQMVSMALKEVKENDRTYLKTIITTCVFLGIIFTAVVYQNGITAHRIKKNGNHRNIELITEGNETIKPTDTIRFIGHTGNYYFYWSKVTEEALIYHQDQIKFVKINKD